MFKTSETSFIDQKQWLRWLSKYLGTAVVVKRMSSREERVSMEKMIALSKPAEDLHCFKL